MWQLSDYLWGPFLAFLICFSFYFFLPELLNPT
jgi:hypothetical protein